MPSSSANSPVSDWQAALLAGAAELDLSLPDGALPLYQRHLDLLLARNPEAGLTTITDPAEIAIKHFLDSLTGLLVRDIGPSDEVADIGPGGGFPGIVLAVARPAAHYTLIESSRKRAAFLRDLIAALGLPQVAVLAARAEEAGRQPDTREHFDLVVSRALASMPVLLEYGLPLAKVGGALLAYKGPKGPDLDSELDGSAPALETLGGRIAEVRPLSLPRGLGERTLVLVEKINPTPPAYPRRPGMPSKKPLGRR